MWYYYYPIRFITGQFEAYESKVYKNTILMYVLLGLINRADTRANYAMIYIIVPAVLYITRYYGSQDNKGVIG